MESVDSQVDCAVKDQVIHADKAHISGRGERPLCRGVRSLFNDHQSKLTVCQLNSCSANRAKFVSCKCRYPSGGYTQSSHGLLECASNEEVALNVRE